MGQISCCKLACEWRMGWETEHWIELLFQQDQEIFCEANKLNEGRAGVFRSFCGGCLVTEIPKEPRAECFLGTKQVLYSS
jgi:hypothetical protein